MLRLLEAISFNLTDLSSVTDVAVYPEGVNFYLGTLIYKDVMAYAIKGFREVTDR